MSEAEKGRAGRRGRAEAPGRSAERDRERSERRRSEGLEQLKTLAIAIAIALAIRAFVIEPFTIPSGSMLPTLLIGDHLFVNKFVYGIKIPYTDVRLPGLREPERGEVVVFTVAKRNGQICPVDRCPGLPRDNFVKRIIGLPGETVEVRDGAVTVDGRPLEIRDTGEVFVDDAGRQLEVRREQAGEDEHAVLRNPRPPSRIPPVEIEVEEGRYLMLGDNRDHSNDGRSWGTVRLADMRGPAFVLYWSWNYNGGWLELLNPLTWLRLLRDETRWDRIGSGIE